MSEYHGQDVVFLEATQLETGYTRGQAAKVVTEWIKFFEAGPSPILHLEFVSRTPRRLFHSLPRQVQLETLEVKWGDYQDLNVLSGLTNLSTLVLRGASNVDDLTPLTQLAALTTFELDGATRVLDLRAIGELSALTSLEIGGNWMSNRNAHFSSIAFLRKMSRLQQLFIHTAVIEDKDYSPILDLPNLTSFRVMRTRGMQPSFEELRRLTSWSE